jgi:hypothetical protein
MARIHRLLKGINSAAEELHPKPVKYFPGAEPVPMCNVAA